MNEDYGLISSQIDEAVNGFVSELKYFKSRKMGESITVDSAREIRLSIFGLGAAILELVTFVKSNETVRSIHDEIKLLRDKAESYYDSLDGISRSRISNAYIYLIEACDTFLSECRKFKEHNLSLDLNSLKITECTKNFINDNRTPILKEYTSKHDKRPRVSPIDQVIVEFYRGTGVDPSTLTQQDIDDLFSKMLGNNEVD